MRDTCPALRLVDRIATLVTGAEKEHRVPEKHRGEVPTQPGCQRCSPRWVKPELRLEQVEVNQA